MYSWLYVLLGMIWQSSVVRGDSVIRMSANGRREDDYRVSEDRHDVQLSLEVST